MKVFRISDQSLEELPVPDLNGIEQLYDFDISPDGRELAAAGYHGVHRWSLSDSEVRHIEWFPHNFHAVSYAPDGHRLALNSGLGGPTRGLVIRNLETGLDEQTIPLPEDVRQVKYLEDGRHTLTVNANGTLYILRP